MEYVSSLLSSSACFEVTHVTPSYGSLAKSSHIALTHLQWRLGNVGEPMEFGSTDFVRHAY